MRNEDRANNTTHAPMLPASTADPSARPLTADDSGRSDVGADGGHAALADADRSQILPVVRRRARRLGEVADPAEERRPHLGRKVVRGLQQLVHRDYGAQASHGSELAAALEYLRALVRWHEETRERHHHQ